MGGEDAYLDSLMEDRLTGCDYHGDDDAPDPYYDNDTPMYEDEFNEAEFEDDTFVDDEIGDGLTDAEADAQTLASAGWGTDEDYGFFGDVD